LIRFVLASASPARLATLRSAGVEPEVIVSHVDESTITGATPDELVANLAAAKAQAVAGRVEPPALVLGCDSMLELDGQMLGKPASVEEAVARWRAMRGRSGVLKTGHCLLEPGPDGRALTRVASTTVRFAEVSDAEIELYCATGEPTQVAGAFTVDGLGGWFVEAISGDHHNVVGLSLPLLRAMLAELGYGLPDLGYPG
jgi:septum formation protein